MAQKGNYLKLRCYAYPEKIDGKDGYSAICIDLSITTWRPTFKEAKSSLDQAILGYLKTMRELLADEKLDSLEQLKHKIYRPAAFFPYRLDYELIRAGSLISPISTIKKDRDWFCEQKLENIAVA